MYYACHMTLLWPVFVAEGMARLNFGACCGLSINEVNRLSQKTSKNRHKLNFIMHSRCGAASRQLLAKVLQLGIDKAGLFPKSIALAMKVLHFVPFISTILILFDKSNQRHALAHVFQLSTKCTENNTGN